MTAEPAGAQVAARLAAVRARIAAAARRAGRDPGDVRLVAVSKYATPEQVRAAYDAGQREFGESRVQNALPRIEALPADVVWHLIGHLQSNKVNKVIGRFELIHSVDSLELARRLANKSAERELATQVLVQVNCSGEAAKAGVDPDAATELLQALRALRGIVVRGLMTMGPLGGDEAAIRASFRRLAELRARMLALDLPELPLDQLSMGMSGDLELAVEEGATLVRVGGAIFAP